MAQKEDGSVNEVLDNLVLGAMSELIDAGMDSSSRVMRQLWQERKELGDENEKARAALERIIEVAEYGRMTDEDRLSDIIGRARAALSKEGS
jgi:hypothetical protein